MTGEGTDGRTERRDRNRRAVVEATLSLVQEGWVDPPVEEVVKRSGLSQRSIFRYFEGLDDLRRAVVQRTLELAAPHFVFDVAPDAPLEARAAKFASRRVGLFEILDRPARLARSREVFNPVIASELARFRSLMDGQVRALFASELGALEPARADELAVLVDVNLSFDAWDLLTRVFGRTPAQVASTWERLLLLLLRSPL